MNTTKNQPWSRARAAYMEFPQARLAVDLTHVDFPDGYLDGMSRPMGLAFEAMNRLEAGAVANPDEGRMVGHYWLRKPSMAPTPVLRAEIEQTVAAVKSFAAEVHAGAVQGENGAFERVLVIGIGGSALGPQFVSHALGHPRRDKLEPLFLDNTDPDGIDRMLARLAGRLGRTLCVVISKSGGTPETRNGMLEVAAAYGRAGLAFARHAVAVTGAGSQLDRVASEQGWLRRFPMWDWVGGRTSETSAVGLLPAALQGLDIEGLLEGARDCDEATRMADARRNPAALLALAWHFLGEGRGARDMVVLPYKDRLELLSRYLQQLVMESLGKEFDLDGRVVNQGLAVYGNKGSTDQHAYVQQLREGVPNFFAVFVEVLRDRETEGAPPECMVEPGVTSGDYLSGFLLGTRAALYEKGRQSITLTVPEVSTRTVGALIALFERAVGLYASLVRINAYHQPGVEAGKKAAAGVLDLQRRAMACMAANPAMRFTADDLAAALGNPNEAGALFKILTRLAANSRGVEQSEGRGVDALFVHRAEIDLDKTPGA